MSQVYTHSKSLAYNAGGLNNIQKYTLEWRDELDVV